MSDSEKRLLTLTGHLAPCPASSPPPPRVLVEFFFDTSSPWSYLAFSRIREVCARSGAELSLRPVIVGGVFNVANKALYASRDAALARAARTTSSASPPTRASSSEGKSDAPTTSAPSPKDVWAARDARAWADFLGLDIKPMMERFNARTRNGAPGHPISAVKMLRGALVAQEESTDALMRFCFASFDAYWRRLLDVSDDAVVRQLHSEAGLSIGLEGFMRRINAIDIKDRLRHNTDELISRGGFGSPTMFISMPDNSHVFKTEMHFGNDRMELVEAAVLRAQGLPWRFHDASRTPRMMPGPSGTSREK